MSQLVFGGDSRKCKCHWASEYAALQRRAHRTHSQSPAWRKLALMMETTIHVNYVVSRATDFHASFMDRDRNQA